MLTRQEFLRSLLMTSLGGAFVAACGTDGGAPEPPTDAGGNAGAADAAGSADAGTFTCGSTTVQIGSNHQHTMVIDPADVSSTTSKEYDITGTSDHPHTVTITAEQFATLRATGMLMVTSSFDDGHTHSIRVRCAS